VIYRTVQQWHGQGAWLPAYQLVADGLNKLLDSDLTAALL
jgi:hypothetical protein